MARAGGPSSPSHHNDLPELIAQREDQRYHAQLFSQYLASGDSGRAACSITTILYGAGILTASGTGRQPVMLAGGGSGRIKGGAPSEISGQADDQPAPSLMDKMDVPVDRRRQ
jgi:hypothetical protein